MISAVICTANPRLDYLERTVRSVLDQDLDNHLWELLIVDNASSTPVATLPLFSDRDVRVVREERVGLTAAKERAAREVSGDVVVFVDDDNVLARDYLGVVAEIFADEDVGVVGPAITAEYEVPPPAWFLDPRIEASVVVRSLPNDRTYVSSVPETGTYFPSGAGSCVRRDVLVSYFSSLTAATRVEGRQGKRLSGGEDWDIGLFAIAQGLLVGTCGGLRLTHLIPSKRLERAYLERLVVGSLDGAAQVNAKWASYFGHAVVPYFNGSPAKETIKGLAHACLGASPRHRILARFHLHLAWLLARRARGDSSSVGSDASSTS